MSANVAPTNELGLDLFLEHIMKPPMKDHITTAILNQLRHERDGYVIDRSTVKGCTDVFASLLVANSVTIYRRDLEPAILKESERFYAKEGKHLLNSCDAPTFLRSVRGVLSRLKHMFIFTGRRETRSRRLQSTSLLVKSNKRPASPDPQRQSHHPPPINRNLQRTFWVEHHG